MLLGTGVEIMIFRGNVFLFFVSVDYLLAFFGQKQSDLKLLYTSRYVCMYMVLSYKPKKYVHSGLLLVHPTKLQGEAGPRSEAKRKASFRVTYARRLSEIQRPSGASALFLAGFYSKTSIFFLGH